MGGATAGCCVTPRQALCVHRQYYCTSSQDSQPDLSDRAFLRPPSQNGPSKVTETGISTMVSASAARWWRGVAESLCRQCLSWTDTTFPWPSRIRPTAQWQAVLLTSGRTAQPRSRARSTPPAFQWAARARALRISTGIPVSAEFWRTPKTDATISQPIHPTAAPEALLRPRHVRHQACNTTTISVRGSTSAISAGSMLTIASCFLLASLVTAEGNCPNAYAYAFDESSGTALWTCDSGLNADYTLTFCPCVIVARLIVFDAPADHYAVLVSQQMPHLCPRRTARGPQ